MSKIKFLSISILFSLAAIGCGKGSGLAKLKDEACACKDKACADAVEKKFEEATKDMKEGSEADAKAAMEAMACIAKLQIPAAPAAPAAP